MDIVKLVVSLFAIALAMLVAVGNFSCCLLNARNRAEGIAKHYKTVPVLGLLLILLGYWLSPWSWKIFFLIVPLLDVANYVMVAGRIRSVLGGDKKGRD